MFNVWNLNKKIAIEDYHGETDVNFFYRIQRTAFKSVWLNKFLVNLSHRQKLDFEKKSSAISFVENQNCNGKISRSSSGVNSRPLIIVHCTALGRCETQPINSIWRDLRTAFPFSGKIHFFYETFFNIKPWHYWIIIVPPKTFKDKNKQCLQNCTLLSKGY